MSQKRSPSTATLHRRFQATLDINICFFFSHISSLHHSTKQARLIRPQHVCMLSPSILATDRAAGHDRCFAFKLLWRWLRIIVRALT